VDACSGCAGDYENPDMTAPDSGLDSERDPETLTKPGGAVTWEGDVENQASVRQACWGKLDPKAEEK